MKTTFKFAAAGLIAAAFAHVSRLRARRRPAPAPASRPRCIPSGHPTTTRPPASRSTTSRSAPAPASSRSRPRRSTSALPTCRLKDDELKAKGLMQFPTVIGGVIPVVNIQGIKPGELKLNGQVLGDIYLGKITKWNDPAIKALNGSLNAARRRHRPGAPRRRFGHHLPVHQLPEQGQRRVEDQGRRGHGRQLADRRGRQGQRRRRRLRQPAAQLDRLRRVRLRQAEQDDLRADAERRRQLRLARRLAPSRPPPPAPTGPRPSTRC